MSNDNLSDGAVAVPAWRERKNLLLAGAVGLAVLVAGGYFVLSGSSEETYEPIPSAASAARANGGGQAAAPTTSPTAAPTVVPALYEEDVFGNPFEPIYPPKPSSAASTAAPAGSAPAPIVDVPVEADTPGSAPVEEPANNAAGDPVSVKLVSVVDEDTVTVRVNGSLDNSTFNARTQFGEYFTLVSTRPDENEATFTFGDGTPFTLREGQTKKFVV